MAAPSPSSAETDDDKPLLRSGLFWTIVGSIAGVIGALAALAPVLGIGPSPAPPSAAPIGSAPTTSSDVVAGQAVAPASVAVAPIAPPGISLEILTTEYRRKDLDGTVYAVSPGAGKLDFRFGWAAHTPDGDLRTDDCVVNAKLTRANGTVVVANPTNNCSQNVGSASYAGSLTPGTYAIQVVLQRPGASPITQTKQIRIDP
jgi:hypothetical protein